MIKSISTYGCFSGVGQICRAACTYGSAWSHKVMMGGVCGRIGEGEGEVRVHEGATPAEETCGING